MRIGRNVVITKGVIIGLHCMIGEGTNVAKGNYPNDTEIISEKMRVIYA